MDMIKSKSLSSHTYNSDIAREISEKIIESYVPEFRQLIEMMERELSG
jgi:hypothetical protein